jgi:hypothetical protein
MNKTKFKGLIAMMMLSILGIIWVQVVWIRNAITIQNEGFNYRVSMSLVNAASTIELSRKMNFFNNQMPEDPVIFGDTSADIQGFMSIQNYSSSPDNKFSISITNQSLSGGPDTGKITTVNKSYIIKNDNSVVADSSTYIVSAADHPGKMNIVKNPEEANTNSRAVYMKQNEFLNWVRKRSSEFQNMS